ncbi:MAG: DUF5058 family protein [Eubacteriaceae bacterium]|nr:DUF5058 family protein [Eubacteriaceae bacterium]
MKSYAEIAASPVLMVLVLAGLAFVAGLCVVFYRKTSKRALELGIPKETLDAVKKNTITLTIVPSISIVIGLFTLSTVIGTAWAWFRLSVVGAVTYELIAAQMATAALGFEEMTTAMGSDASTFAAIMLVMSIGIIFGNVFNLFAGKALVTTIKNAGTKQGGFGPIMNGCFMLALMGVMLPFQAIKGGVYIAVMLTSLAVAYLMNLLIKKTGATWLGNFTMAFTLIIGMASSLFWLKVF